MSRDWYGCQAQLHWGKSSANPIPVLNEWDAVYNILSLIRSPSIRLEFTHIRTTTTASAWKIDSASGSWGDTNFQYLLSIIHTMASNR